MRRLKNTKEDINFKIRRLGNNKIARKDMLRRRDMIEKIERPIRSCYSMVSNNRLHIHAIFNGMDFSRLVSIINNTCSPEEFDEGVETMQRSLLSKGYINEQGNVQMNAIEERLAQVDGMLNVNLEPEKQEEEEDLLGAMLGNKEDKAEEDLLGAFLGQEKQPQERARVGNRDDDIM